MSERRSRRIHPTYGLLAASVLGFAAQASANLDIEPSPFTTAAVDRAPLSITSETERLLKNLLQDQGTLAAELEKVDERAAQLRLMSVARARAYVRLVRVGLIPASAGIEELVEHASKAERLRRALERDLETEKQLADLKLRLLKKRSEIDERLNAMRAERRLMEQNRVALEAARDRALAFERAFLDGQHAAHTTIYGAGVGPAEPATLDSGFGSLKGRLPFPLTGRTEIRPARRRAASGPALEMLAPSGSVVRAVFPGTVAFADEYADYGKSIIVDHGAGYFTVSANLASIDVTVGEDVGSGVRLGTIAGAAGRAVLYFEIRHGTDTLDPADWFGI